MQIAAAGAQENAPCKVNIWMPEMFKNATSYI